MSNFDVGGDFICSKPTIMIALLDNEHDSQNFDKRETFEYCSTILKIIDISSNSTIMKLK